MKELILTVGLPRSGKSTWAKQQGCPIVNPDSIRYALHGQRFQSLAEPFVWACATLMVRALFLAGHEKVIVDATNNTRKRRDFWRSSDWEVKCKIIDTSREICIQRAMEKKDIEILPIIERMAMEKEPVGQDEIMTY